MSAVIGESGILHTKSSYFGSAVKVGESRYNEIFSDKFIQADLTEALNYAMKKELDFYHLFFPAVGGYREFIGEVRKIFAEAEEDAKLLQKLSNATLQSLMPKNLTDTGEEWSLQIIFDSKSVPIDLSRLNTETTEININEVYVGLDSDGSEAAVAVKKYMYDLIGKATKPGNDYGFIGGRKGDIYMEPGFKSASTKTSNDKFLAWLENQDAEILEKIGIKYVKITNKASNFYEKLNIKIRPFAKYKKSDIHENWNDPKFQKEFDAAFQKVKAFIYDPLLSGSEILQQAAKDAWNSILGEAKSELWGYFFEGRNVYKSVLGNGGEFQLKVIKNYLSIAVNKYDPTLGQVIGGIGTGKRQEPRSDFQIMEMLGADIGNFIAGIQVKNVSEGTASALHISSDLELIAPNLPDDLRDTLANSMFNSDIKSQVGDAQKLLEQYIKTYFWRAMNLHVNDDLHPNHTNTFYFVGGTSLVPASKIILDMINTNTKTKPPKFTIGNLSAPIDSDEGFASRDDIDRKPEFLEYFKPIKYLGFGEGSLLEENGENKSLYNQLLEGVSVSCDFNINAIITNLNKINPIEFFPH